MLFVARWQPRKPQRYPSEITFWVRVTGVPLEFRTAPTFESFGDAIGRSVAIDADHSRFQVVVDAFKELCLETTVDFKGGEFYEGEEALISLRYEKLFGYCKICYSLCHKDKICPFNKKNSKKSPERKQEAREGNGGGYDGGMNEDRTRSYKGVVINGNGGQQTKVEIIMGKAKGRCLRSRSQNG